MRNKNEETGFQRLFSSVYGLKFLGPPPPQLKDRMADEMQTFYFFIKLFLRSYLNLAPSLSRPFLLYLIGLWWLDWWVTLWVVTLGCGSHCGWG